MKSVASSAALSAILGITEPAMYGVNLKYRKPFAFAMVSSAISAAFLSFFHAGAMAYAPPGLFTIITYQADSFVFIILGAAMSLRDCSGFDLPVWRAQREQTGLIFCKELTYGNNIPKRLPLGRRLRRQPV